MSFAALDAVPFSRYDAVVPDLAGDDGDEEYVYDGVPSLCGDGNARTGLRAGMGAERRSCSSVWIDGL